MPSDVTGCNTARVNCPLESGVNNESIVVSSPRCWTISFHTNDLTRSCSQDSGSRVSDLDSRKVGLVYPIMVKNHLDLTVLCNHMCWDHLMVEEVK
jgi:hypothetical protein